MSKDQILDIISQLVKYKDIEQYLQLCIPIDYKQYIYHSKENNKNIKKPLLLYKTLANYT